MMNEYELYTEIVRIRDMVAETAEPQIEKATVTHKERAEPRSLREGHTDERGYYRRRTLKDARSTAHHATFALNTLAKKFN